MANNSLEWMLITANPEIAAHAEKCGVHRIFVDMEVMGKAERQGHLDTHKAAHSFADVAAVRAVLNTAELMVRLNPLHAGTPDEVAQAIASGGQRLMLPMFVSVADVASFKQIVAGRVPVTFLAETPQAFIRLTDWVDLLEPMDEVYFGLNDLSIAMGLDFLFEPLAAGMFDRAACLLRERDIAFGIGGIARANTGEILSNHILGEHVRLGCSRLILSRAFHGCAKDLSELQQQLDLALEVAHLHDIERAWKESTAQELADNHQQLAQCIFNKARELQAHE